MNLSYETFKTSIVSFLQTHFGGDTDVSLQPIVKNNNLKLDGLIIQSAAINVSPTIYLNAYYEDYLSGTPISTIQNEIMAAYHKNLPKHSMDFSFFTDFEKVKYQIIYKLINYEQNFPLLEHVPHVKFLDLAVVFCCFLPDTPNGAATILIHKHHLGLWNIDENCLYELAMKNTPILLPCEIKSMNDVMKSLCPEIQADESFPDAAKPPEMYVLTNTEKLYGASAILYPNILSYFAKRLKADLYLLPSSIHEVLLLPNCPDINLSELNCIVQEVNQSHVQKEEILSDHAYLFKQDAGLFTH